MAGYLCGLLLGCCHIHSAVATPNPNSAPSSPIATQRPFLKKMEHGHSLCPDNEGVEVWDDSSEEMPTPSASIDGQNTEAKASPTSTSTPKHVTPLIPISKWFSSTQLSGLYYRALVLFFLFAFWRSLSYSVSVRTASPSNQPDNVCSVPCSTIPWNPSFCYSASLSIRKSKGLWPSSSPQTTILVPPILKRCDKKNNTVIWSERSNERLYEALCSDAFIQDIRDFDFDGWGAAHSCLARCISDNYECEGVLYLVDRPFENNCFFQHNNEWPAFEASERVFAAKLWKD